MSQFSQIIFQSPALQIGLFRCPPSVPEFEDTGPIRIGHLLVFPRTSVRITHRGGEPIIADPNLVMFYNCQQEYRRTKVSERGDICEWFAFSPTLLVGALANVDRAAAEQLEKPFRFTHGPIAGTIYLQQRSAVEHILRMAQPDPLFVEETMCGVLDAVLHGAYRAHDGDMRSAPYSQQQHLNLTRATQELLAARYCEALTLADLAAELPSSPFQLCRIFRRQTGYSIHQYLNQLRLRTALEAIAHGAEDLTRLALDLGYASHSHFTQAFRPAFGLPPGRWRARLCAEMRKNLIA